MNLKSIASLVFLVSCTAAHAQQSVVLCSSPLMPDCVDPRWGQIEPESNAGGGSAAAETAVPERVAARGIHMAVRLQTAAVRAPRATAGTIKAVIDDGSKFKRETDRLTAALKRARFDHDGRIVSGEEAIAQAALAASKAAPDYELTLYIKAPPKLSADHAAVLANKVGAVNRILEKAASADSDKPQG